LNKKEQNIALIAGGGVLLYIILDKFFGKSDQAKKIAQIEKEPTADGSTQAELNGMPFTDVMANSVANTLHDYMRYCGTDEDGIFQLLNQGYNGKALQKIYKAFGLREAGVIAGCHGDTWPFPGEDKDLGTYLNAELSGEDELDGIRAIFRKANIVF
jgi:hypothetical protein